MRVRFASDSQERKLTVENLLCERITSARKSSGKSQKEIAQVLGISTKSWQDYEAGHSVPGGKVFEGLVRLGFNANWLLAGEGPMRRGAYPAEGTIGAGNLTPYTAGDEYVHLPLYNVRAAAGEGTLVESEEVVDVLAFKAAWIRSELRLSPASLYLIYVEGESMEPTLRPGDLILVDRSATVRDGIYVLRIDDGLLVKRLQRLPGNQIDITSDNPAYKPFSLDLSKGIDGVDIVGRVVWSGRRM